MINSNNKLRIISRQVICFINPKETFNRIADILGFLVLTIALWWLVRAFVERSINPLWWLGLIGAICMIVLAFWTWRTERRHQLVN